MRTGIIHLTGLAATLLFALTLIAWVDSYRHDLSIGAAHMNHWIGIRCISSGFVANHSTVYPGDKVTLSTQSSFRRVPRGTYPTDGHDRSWLGVGWGQRSDEMPQGSEMVETYLLIPYWLVATCFAASTFLYLRFLKRRKRHPSVDDDSVDSEASGLAGSSDVS